MDARLNVTASPTPARSAFARDASMAPASRSKPRITGLGGSTSASAAASRRSQRSRSKLGQDSNAKERERPGGIRLASSAASIGIVPEPQNGSTNGELRSHPLESTSAAA